MSKNQFSRDKNIIYFKNYLLATIIYNTVKQAQAREAVR